MKTLKESRIMENLRWQKELIRIKEKHSFSDEIMSDIYGVLGSLVREIKLGLKEDIDKTIEDC